MSNGENKGSEELSIGKTLEQARKARGLSIKEVEQATKIRARYLEALEREDFGVLPDAVYVRGFLKTYAGYLGLDGEALSQELKSRRAPRRERQEPAYTPPVKINETAPRPSIPSTAALSGAGSRRTWSKNLYPIALALVILVSIVGAFYYVGRGTQLGGGPGAPQPAPQENPSGSSNAVPPANSTTESGAQKGIQVAVDVKDSPSWIKIQVDGELALEQTVQPGFSRAFKAQREVDIATGNAGAVFVKVNGQDMGPMGSSGEVLSRRYTYKPGG